MQPPSDGPSADETLKCDPQLQLHLAALGVNSFAEYTAWCTRHGFSPQLEKHWRDRCRERYVAAQDAIHKRLARTREERRKPHLMLERIFAGELDQADLRQPTLRLIHQSLAAIDSELIRQSFCDLLLYVHRDSKLISSHAAWPTLGCRPGNTFIEGLLALARLRERWLRPLSSWKLPSHNARRQFSTLSSHLLALYPVPTFLDSVWFRGTAPEAQMEQELYLALSRGDSPRACKLPIRLSRRMVHFFLHAPKDFLVDQALRYAQVINLGGDARLVRAILSSRLGTCFENDDFWTTVIRWFAQHPQLDSAQIGPLIDFIHRQRFEPEHIDADGSAGPSIRPEFTMKGRTVSTLLTQMRQWHERLRKQPAKPQLEWLPSGIAGFEIVDGTLASGNLRRWTVVELVSRKELHHEGQVMRHCVASYDTSCYLGKCSIWSLGVEKNGGQRRQVLTIEVANRTKVICQVRGKANRLPTENEIDILRRWALQEQLVLSGLLTA